MKQAGQDEFLSLFFYLTNPVILSIAFPALWYYPEEKAYK
jgi:hypothetical protein